MHLSEDRESNSATKRKSSETQHNISIDRNQPVSPDNRNSPPPDKRARRRTRTSSLQDNNSIASETIPDNSKIKEGIKLHAEKIAKTIHVKNLQNFLTDINFHTLSKEEQTQFKLEFCKPLFKHE